MQNAKDTFYMTLRDRIAALNPARTALVRGQLRPAVLVEENELASAFDHIDTFVLRWTEMSVNAEGPRPLVTMRCEIRYATRGNSGNGGMDRGRLLSAMDAELAAAINAAPQHAAKTNYANAAAAAETSIFWSNVSFAPSQMDNGELCRVATVEVFSYQEAGER